MPEHEPPDFEQCAVCGRTMLRGERLWDYVTSGGEPRGVCVLCKSRAEAAGWVPAELANAAEAPPPRPSRARALRDRLARAAESTRPARPAEDDEPEAEPPPRRRRRLLVEREPSPKPADDEEGDAEAREQGETRTGGSDREAGEGGAHRSPDDPHRRTRIAVDRFNASEARRTVAGLIRSLGEPHASIQLAGRGRAKVIVAWELSWYQWEIDPGEHGEVREVRKGTEIDELSEAEREWNARVDDDGGLRLSAA